MDLPGRIAIVTGASSGIGEATARELAEAGVRVVLAARSAGRLESLAAELNARPAQVDAGPRAMAIAVDVTDRVAVQSMVAHVMAAWGRVDILVNNAGEGLYAPLADATEQGLRRVMDVNYFGALNCVYAVAPPMRAQREGMIVTVGSIVGKHVTPLQGAYCASKAALMAASDALRVELKPSGICVLTGVAGVTQTEFQTHARREGVAPPSRAGIRGVTSQQVAQAIVRAIRRGGPAEVYVTMYDRAYVTFATHFPRLTDRILLHLVNRRR